jgi:nucleoid DNA-binding protein
MKAGTALNPRTGERIKLKVRKTIRFKASPELKQGV